LDAESHDFIQFAHRTRTVWFRQLFEVVCRWPNMHGLDQWSVIAKTSDLHDAKVVAAALAKKHEPNSNYLIHDIGEPK